MTVTSEPAATKPAGDRRLRRDIGRIGLLFAGVGSIIGSGWLFGGYKTAMEAGPAGIFSWAIGTVMILLIGLTYAELGPMVPVSGGVVRYPHLVFGSFASFTMGWVTWIAAATVAPIEVEGALQYATKFAPFTEANPGGVHTLTGLGYGVAVIGMALFVVINYVGVRYFAQINNVLVWWKLAVIIVVIIAFLFTSFHASNFTSHGFAPSGAKGIFSAIATAGIVFSFLGFRQGVELAGETSNPKRNIPFAIIGSILLTGVIYVLLQVAFIGATDPGALAKSGSWANLSFTNSFGPLAAIAGAIGLGWLAWVLYIDAIISPADTGLVYTTVTSRIAYAMGRNDNAPRKLASTTNRGTPLVSLVVTFIVGLIVFLPFPSWQQLVGFITSATVLSFGTGPLVLAALRRAIPEHERPFRLPGGDTIPFLAFYSANMIVYWAGWSTNWKLFVSILLGLVVLVIFRLTGQVHTPKWDWKAGATWLVPWLACLALISYLGEFGDGLGLFGIGWGFVINLVLSVVIYAIALKVRLPKAEVEEHLGASKGESADDLLKDATF